MNTQRPVVSFDPHGASYAENWSKQLKEMRETSPVAWTEAHGGFWVLTKYEDIVYAERNPALFSCDHDLDGSRNGTQGIRIPASQVRFSLNESDPPEHTALRRLEAPFFSIQALERWIALAQQIVDDQIDTVIESGRADLVHDITIPVPAQVTLRLVGIPTEEWRDFMATSLTTYLPPDHPDFPNAERARIAEKIDALMADRKTAPRDDVISALVHAKVSDQALPHGTAKGMLQSLVYGGFDSTAATSANAIFWLERHRDLHPRLIEDDKFLEQTVDEVLRYYSPVMGGLARTVMEDTELRGQKLRKGERVLLMFNSANFDSDQFENPEEFQPERRNARQNLSFGAGPHRCLGAALGMAEVRLITRAVIKRLQNYKIDHDKARRVPRLGGVNAWLTMPVTFTPGKRLKG